MLDELLQLLVIAHHIPGRVRLKLMSLEQAQKRGFALADVERFSSALRQVEGVRSVTMNTAALSCIIEYNPDILPNDSWSAMLSGVTDHVGAATMLRQIDSALTVNPQS